MSSWPMELEEVYQGHPTTLLMPDGKTIFCVWTYDHGGRCGPMARSDDGGLQRGRGSITHCPRVSPAIRTAPAYTAWWIPRGRKRLWAFLGATPTTHHERRRRCRRGTRRHPSASNAASYFQQCGAVEGRPLPRDVSPPMPRREIASRHANRNRRRRTDWFPPVVVADVEGKLPCEPYVFRSPDDNECAADAREHPQR